jgi:hypothetical protein
MMLCPPETLGRCVFGNMAITEADPGAGESGGTRALNIKIHGEFQ